MLEEAARRYSDLVAENRILRTDLKNAAVHAAYLEHAPSADRSGAVAVAEERDRLGQMYFDEVVAAAKKAITPAPARAG
jgi:hypothetical protein